MVLNLSITESILNAFFWLAKNLHALISGNSDATWGRIHTTSHSKALNSVWHISRWYKVPHRVFLTQDLFHSTSLATCGSSEASKERKFYKELTLFGFVRYFSAKIEQSSKMFKTGLRNAHFGCFLTFAQFWQKSNAWNKE